MAAGLVAAVPAPASAKLAVAQPVPRPDHVVVVVMENHDYDQIIANDDAPYINELRVGGAHLTNFFATTHPSQPNYFAMFSGNSQGITNDDCYTPGFSSAPNLASELISAGKTWTSYNDGLPTQGSNVCTSGDYARKHNPWFAFRNAPLSTAKTFSQFPTNYTELPNVSFVIPDLCHDMHDCSRKTGDAWLRFNLGNYARWAKTHNSLLVVTFDEDDNGLFDDNNQVAAVFYGQPVKAHAVSKTAYNHHSLLRTLEDMFGTAHAGHAGTAPAITGIWN
ncbi:alkaline phosphatase family protein [Streptomyces sp900105245]|uniref:Alkaline phosphatase family protein n=1 Tax=Streptomyces sp. 900105245 TaxID=3154379 RepID=A0ABV1UL82_9ACTN